MLNNKSLTKLKEVLKDKTYFYSISILLLGLIPILPFRGKGVLVAIFIITAILSLQNKTRKLNYFYLINTVLFIGYLISLLYTDTIKQGLSILETTLSLFIFPLGFMLFSGNNKIIKSILKQEKKCKYVFIGASFFLAILIFYTSLEFGNYGTEKINLNNFLKTLNQNFYWLTDHPIYLSIFLAVSLLMIASLYKNSNKKSKFLLALIGFFQIFVLILMSRKGILFSVFLSIFLFFILYLKLNKKHIIQVIIISIFFSLITFKYAPDTLKRFRETFDSKSYKKIENYSSTSIRYGIYKCAFHKSSNSWLIGYGVGDVKNELLECYQKTSPVLVKGQYNSHNQYLKILLSIGFIGLMLFLVSLFINLKLFYIKKDYFAFCLLIMYMGFMLTENILDRQNGVILFSFLLNYYCFKNTNLDLK